MNGVSKAMVGWGLVCLAGLGVYPFIAPFLGFSSPLALGVLLVLVGCAGTIVVVHHPWANKAVRAWIVLALAGMSLYAATIPMLVSPVFVNGLAWWSLVLTLGFGLTGRFWKSHYWYGVAALNAFAFVLIVFHPELVGDFRSLVLAFTSGIPLVYAGMKG